MCFSIGPTKLVMKKILIIDDQQDNLTALKAVIKSRMPDSVIISSNSGPAGIRRAQEEQPDTILLDIHMPIMDGYEVCRKLRKSFDTKHIPIILITAIRTDSQSRAKALENGAEALLTKPVDPVELMAQIKVMFRIKEAEDKLRNEKNDLILEVEKRTIKLKESEKNYRLLIENQTDLIIKVDSKGRVLFASPSVYNMFGIGKNDHLGNNYRPTIHDDDKIKTNSSIELLFKPPYNITLINRVQTIDGWKWIEWTGKSILNNQNKVVEIIITGRDINERKKAELLLIENKEKLNQIVHGNTIATFVIDTNHRVTHWNKACVKLTGVAEEDIIGTSNHSNVFYNEKRPIMADIIIEDSPAAALDKLYKGKYQKSSLVDNAYTAEDFFPNLGNNGKWLFFTAVPLYNGTKIIGAAETLQDITLEKENEIRLIESEEKYRNLVERANDGICIVQNQIVKYTNSCLLNIWGGKREDIVGSPFTKFMHPDKIEELVSYYEKRIAGENVPSIYETILLNNIGEKVYAELSAGIINYLGKPADLIIVRDISERKKSENEIVRLSTAVEQGPSTIVITDLTGTIEYVNPKFNELTGYSNSESIGAKSNILNSGDQPNIYFEELWKTIMSGNVWHGEFQNKKKNGELYWESASISPIHDNSGAITNFVKIAIDITEKKRADQIQLILYNISNAVIRTDTLEELFSIIKRELGTIIDTRNFYVALHNKEDDTLTFPYYTDEKDQFTKVPASKTLTKYIIETKKPLLADLELQKRFVEEGKLVPIGSKSKVWLGVPLKINDVVTGAFAVQSYEDENAFKERDMQMLEYISEQISIAIHRKEAVDNLLIALDKATESDKLKTAFLQNISHEIRTPMNGIFGFASLLKDPNLTGEEQQAYIDVIMISGKRMLGTLNDLMDISMIETEQMKLNYSFVNVNKELVNLYSFFNGETNQLNLQLSYTTPLPDSLITIKTDKSKLYAILANLIKNAIKYSDKGKIDFGYNIVEDKIQFHVTDNGIGISAHKLDSIFNRFEQADIEDVKVHEGSGLGLSISKGYVELLGGKIWAESIIGKGSQFYFTIPYIVNQDDYDVNEYSKPDISQHNKSPKIKILIAEDEIFADEYLKIILADICPDPLHALNGKEAVRLSKENSDLDLILMDIKMPILNGYEAIKQIREFNKDVIIIAQTAYALAGDREKAMEAGANDYISKPINSQELIQKIKTIFQ